MTQARCPPFTDGPASCVATPTPKVHQARIRRIARRGSLGSIARTHSVGASPFAPMARPLWFAFETRLAGQGGGSHRRLGDVQVIDEGLGPGLAVVLGHRQKLALVVGVAQRMACGLERAIRRPAVVDSHAGKRGQDAVDPHGLDTTPGVDHVVRQGLGACAVQPMKLAFGAQSRLVKVDHRRFEELLSHGVLERLKGLSELVLGRVQRGLAHAMTGEIEDPFAHAVRGEKLVDVGIRDERLHGVAVLGLSDYAVRKGRGRDMT